MTCEEENCVLDLLDQNAEIGKTPIVLTDRYYMQTLHVLKDEYQTKCNQMIKDVLGGSIFQIANLDIPHRTKKCKRCFPITKNDNSEDKK